MFNYIRYNIINMLKIFLSIVNYRKVFFSKYENMWVWEVFRDKKKLKIEILLKNELF